MRWSAFPLHPETPAEGRSLNALFGVGTGEVRAIVRQLQQVADSLGLPFGQRSMTYNTRLAQELAKWAEAEGMGDRMHDALFRAYFAEGRNLADVEVLIAVAGSVGLDPHKAEAVLVQRTRRAAVDSDWKRAAALGLKAVPTFLMGPERLVGAQELEKLERLVADGGGLLR